MNGINLKRLQAGYMHEIPMIMLAAGVVLSIVSRWVPPVPGKVLMVAWALTWIGGLYYIIIVPGWSPGHQSKAHQVVRWIIFLLLAAVLSFIAGAYVLGVTGTPYAVT